MRFFAAFSVMLMHAWYPFMGHWPPGPLALMFAAVGFFFVLSGVVLAWSWTPGTTVHVQWRRRAARVVPMHWLMTTMIGVLVIVDQRVAPPGVFTAAALRSHVFFLNAWPPYSHFGAFNAPSWSLSAEMFFYLLFPFVVRFVAAWSVRGLVGAGAAAVGLYVALGIVLNVNHVLYLSGAGLLLFPPVQFLKFFAGVCVGTALRKGWRPHVRLGGATATVAAVLAGLGFYPGLAPKTQQGQYLANADLLMLVPIVMLVVAGAMRDLDPSGSSRRNRALVVLGAESFALYLVHWPALTLTRLIQFKQQSFTHPGPWWLILYLAFCMLAAGLLHHGFEKPLERVLRSGRSPKPAPSHEGVRLHPVHAGAPLVTGTLAPAPAGSTQQTL